MIKAIFFDAAGILYKRSSPTEKFALQLLAENGFNTEPSEEKKATLLSIRAQANGGKVSHETYWDLFLLSRGVTEKEQRKDLYTRIVTFSNDVDPVPGAHEALAELKQKGLQLGIITDTMYPLEWKMKRLEKAGVASFIDIVSCSTDIGAHKPDPVIYDYAIKQTNFLPGECAFVGHLGVELQGAQSVGLVTIAIEYDEGTQADYYCDSIKEIFELPIFTN